RPTSTPSSERKPKRFACATPASTARTTSRSAASARKAFRALRTACGSRRCPRWSSARASSSREADVARSHPPSLLRLAERTLRDECGVLRGERLLVASSGGGDSTALLHVLSLLAPKLGVSIVAHGVDHGLRPEARAELDVAEGLATRLSVPFS